MTGLENIWQEWNDILAPEMVQDYEVTIWCKWKNNNRWSRERGLVFMFNPDELNVARKKIESIKTDPDYKVSKVELRPRLKSVIL
jgi:hypothetical protein